MENTFFQFTKKKKKKIFSSHTKNTFHCSDVYKLAQKLDNSLQIVKITILVTHDGGKLSLVWQILILFQTTKYHFSYPFSDLASKKLSHHYLDWNTIKNDFLIRTFLSHFFFYSVEWINTLIHSHSSLETTPDNNPYPFSDQIKTAQKLYPLGSFGVAHTYMAYIRKYSPPDWNRETL